MQEDMPEKKRRQHYVWQHYLRSWATDGSVWCERAGKRFKTGTGTVAHQTDFYRLKEMSEKDLLLIEHVLSQIQNPMLREAARGWKPLFLTLHEVKRELDGAGEFDPEKEKRLDVAFNNLEEDLHAYIESDSVEILRLLREANQAVLELDKFGRLGLFIATQYCRTSQMAKRASASTAGLGGAINVEAAWGLLRTIYSTTIGYSIFEGRERSKLSFLDAAADEEFITGDQPIINLRAVGLAAGVIPTELELYYPLDPRRALVISFDAEGPAIVRATATAEEVLRYNRALKVESGGQVYARSESALAKL